MSDLPITPETKVAHLLEAYPDLEAVLIESAPVFERLKNPVLRQTVARLTTLERAAGIAGLEVRTLVRRLREAAGQPVGEDIPAPTEASCQPGGHPPPDPRTDEPPPDWIAGRTPTTTVDADLLLEANGAPLPRVLEAARALDAEGLLLMLVSFKPLPMVEVLEAQGFRTHLRTVDDGRVGLYVAPEA